MFRRTVSLWCFSVFLLALVVFSGCQFAGSRHDPSYTVTILPTQGTCVDLGIEGEFFIVPAFVPEDFTQVENESVNDHDTQRVFTACNPNSCQQKIFVETMETGTICEITSTTFLSWRPFSDFVWETADSLSFTQWSQPHYGLHYIVNVEKKELICLTALHSD